MQITKTNETQPIDPGQSYANSAIRPKITPTAMLKSLSALLAAAPVKVAMLGPVVCGCTPGGRVPVADIEPQEYETPALEAVADTTLDVRDGPVTAGTRPTLVVTTAGGWAIPAGPLVAGAGVAVTNETRGTVTAVVIMVMVEAMEMV